jgi:hypothetical protein
MLPSLWQCHIGYCRVVSLNLWKWRGKNGGLSHPVAAWVQVVVPYDQRRCLHVRQSLDYNICCDLLQDPLHYVFSQQLSEGKGDAHWSTTQSLARNSEHLSCKML